MTDATNSTTLSTQGTTLSTPGSTLTPANNGLGENDFLQLMMDQLKNQDPLQPSDPTQYLSELANFSTLEQETSTATSSQTSATEQSSAAALQLLGKTVNYTDANDTTQTGTVQKVDFTSAGPKLTISGTAGIPLSSITEAS